MGRIKKLKIGVWQINDQMSVPHTYSLYYYDLYIKIRPDTIAGNNKTALLIHDIPNMPMIVKYHRIGSIIYKDSVEIVWIGSSYKKCYRVLCRLRRHRNKQYDYTMPNMY